LCLLTNTHRGAYMYDCNVLLYNSRIKARFPLPELTDRVDGWPVSITRQLGPLTRAANSGSGNRALGRVMVPWCSGATAPGKLNSAPGRDWPSGAHGCRLSFHFQHIRSTSTPVTTHVRHWYDIRMFHTSSLVNLHTVYSRKHSIISSWSLIVLLLLLIIRIYAVLAMADPGAGRGPCPIAPFAHRRSVPA